MPFFWRFLPSCRCIKEATGHKHEIGYISRALLTPNPKLALPDHLRSSKWRASRQGQNGGKACFTEMCLLHVRSFASHHLPSPKLRPALPSWVWLTEGGCCKTLRTWCLAATPPRSDKGTGLWMPRNWTSCCEASRHQIPTTKHHAATFLQSRALPLALFCSPKVVIAWHRHSR